MRSAKMPAATLEGNTDRYPGIQAGIADTTLRVKAAMP